MISRPATSWSVGRAALIAGAALLLMAVVAGLAKFVALDGLITPGDAARTATDIIGSADTFRFGTLGLILVIVLDVIVACALYRVFSAVNSSISLLAAGFRLVFAAVFLAAVGRLVGAARLLDGPPVQQGASVHVDEQHVGSDQQGSRGRIGGHLDQ